jgi:hypothetical protein
VILRESRLAKCWYWVSCHLAGTSGYLHGVCRERNSKMIAGKGRQKSRQMSIGSSSRVSAFLAPSSHSPRFRSCTLLRSTFATLLSFVHTPYIAVHPVRRRLAGATLLRTSFIHRRLSFRTVLSSSKSLVSDGPLVRPRQVSMLSIHLPAGLLPNNALVFVDWWR